MENKIKKLPKWVQEHIKSLEREVARLTKDLKTSMGGNKETDAFVRIGTISDDKKFFLPKNSDVNFNLGEDKDESCFSQILCGIRYKSQYGCKVLCINGNRSIQIDPQAANSINIMLKD